jgi:hypothetical protein
MVAKGYVVREEVDSDEVFAHVARLDSVRLLITITQMEDASSRHQVYIPKRRTLVFIKGLWCLYWLLEDFGVSAAAPTPLLLDSTSVINIADDPVKHELTKNIGVEASFVCAVVQDQVLALQYVPAELELALFLTKAQTRAL